MHPSLEPVTCERVLHQPLPIGAAPPREPLDVSSKHPLGRRVEVSIIGHWRPEVEGPPEDLLVRTPWGVLRVTTDTDRVSIFTTMNNAVAAVMVFVVVVILAALAELGKMTIQRRATGVGSCWQGLAPQALTLERLKQHRAQQ
jgi:hypothetical protein